MNYHAGVVVWKRIRAAAYCDLWRRACNSKPSMAKSMVQYILYKIPLAAKSNILVARAKVSTAPSRVPYPKRRSIASVEGGPRIGPNLVTLVLEPEASCRLPSGNFSQQPMDGSSFPGPHVQSPAVSLSSEANDLGLQAGALRKALLRCIASCQSTSLFLMTPRL